MAYNEISYMLSTDPRFTRLCGEQPSTFRKVKEFFQKWLTDNCSQHTIEFQGQFIVL
jgi:hypothetical protein